MTFSMPLPPAPTPSGARTPVRRAAATNGNGNKPRKINLVPVIVIIVLVAMTAGIVWFVKSRTSTNAGSFDDKEIVRELTQKVTPPDSSKIFNKKVIRALNNGADYNTAFVVKYNGQEMWRQPFQIPALEMTATTKRPRRRQDVQSKIKEFDELAQQWANYQGTVIDEVILDNTEGVSEPLVKQIRSEMQIFNLDDLLAMGNGVEFWTFKLSNTFFLDDDFTVVKQGVGSLGLGKIDTKLGALLARDTSRSNSSVATGLFKALTKNQGKKFRTVLIVTDGLENADLANFYREPPRNRKNADDWNDQDQKLWDKLQSKEKCPDLSGVRIYLRGPKSGKAADQTQLALKFWQAGLKKAGAQVEMEY